MVVEMVLGKQVDIGFTEIPISSAGPVAFPMPELPRLLAIPEEHPLASKDVVHLRDLAGEDFIVLALSGRKEQLAISHGEPFSTPKPERLIQRILHIATNPRHLVLESFLGSGTTAAVAREMGRRWIGIEMRDHARTHCALRLRKVIDGEQGGISQDGGWQGGGVPVRNARPCGL